MNRFETWPEPVSRNLPQRLTATLLRRYLKSLRHGELVLLDGPPERFGSPGDPLTATLQVREAAFYPRTVTGNDLGLAESYLLGEWVTDNLKNLLQILIRNYLQNVRLSERWSVLKSLGGRLRHWLHRNSHRNSRRNIAAHYDLGNEFFQLFLDPTLMYSSAIFPRRHSSLEEASLFKLDHVCRQLDLRPQDHLMEIGTGWGGLAIHAATHYGCRVTTTTLSRQQFALANERVRQAGLQDRIEILLTDYRDLRGQYDKLVSVEMIEAVGHRYLDSYFRKCSDLLKPDGVMLLQGILMPDQRYADYLRSTDFIQQYVFPGGCLPSPGAILGSLGRATNLQPLHWEDMTPHYARTLECWRENFFDRIDQVRGLGYEEQFIRLWEYYFCYCQAAFEERAVNVAQVLLGKPQCRRDLFRQPENTGAGQREMPQLSWGDAPG